MPDPMGGAEQHISGATLVELVPSIAPDSFGLGYAGLNLALALERAGMNVFLASVDRAKDATDACEEAGFPLDRFIRGSLVGHPRLRFAPFLVHQLLKLRTNGRVIVHAHGLWTYMSHVAGVLRQRWQCPLIISPHGSLEPYALTISRGKKAIASLLYERRNLATASCLWALSEQEERSVQAYGFAGRVAVIPNGVGRAVVCGPAEVAEFRSRHDVPPESRILLFLSRIARKKNLPLLLRAFAKNVEAGLGWTLLIAGSDERGHIDEVRALVRALGIGKSVRLIGPVFGREKARAFSSASLFVLPSISEGLPIAVLEAMEYGKPVLVTEGWSLPIATDAKFGWRVVAEQDVFQGALFDAMSTSAEALVEMGRTGRSIVREHFSWDSVARRACALYGSLLSGSQGTTN